MKINMPVVHVVSGRQRKLYDGSPWVYRNEIERIDDDVEDGGLVRVVDAKGHRIGTGLVNTQSVITVRLLTYRDEEINGAFIAARVARAVAYRAPFRRPDTDGVRLLFGEADGLPGVVADRFGPVIVVQIHSLGMERWKDVIGQTLVDLEQPETLLFANDDPIRLKEGLPVYRTTFFGPERDACTMTENGIRFHVDLRNGQKTGHFLDQKANHRFARRLAKDRKVLDCFTYSGGFALHAASGGAAQVEAVDISDTAISSAIANAEDNQLSVRFKADNVFDDLRARASAAERFDLIVLDPPAFAASHKAIAGATRGYKEINLSAMKLLPPGGILATHSCSFHMKEEPFVKTVLSAAHDLGRHARIISLRRQDYDHPVLAGHPESHYLKSLWLQMLD